ACVPRSGAGKTPRAPLRRPPQNGTRQRSGSGSPPRRLRIRSSSRFRAATPITRSTRSGRPCISPETVWKVVRSRGGEAARANGLLFRKPRAAKSLLATLDIVMGQAVTTPFGATSPTGRRGVSAFAEHYFKWLMVAPATLLIPAFSIYPLLFSLWVVFVNY